MMGWGFCAATRCCGIALGAFAACLPLGCCAGRTPACFAAIFGMVAFLCALIAGRWILGIDLGTNLLQLMPNQLVFVPFCFVTVGMCLGGAFALSAGFETSAARRAAITATNAANRSEKGDRAPSILPPASFLDLYSRTRERPSIRVNPTGTGESQEIDGYLP